MAYGFFGGAIISIGFILIIEQFVWSYLEMSFLPFLRKQLIQFKKWVFETFFLVIIPVFEFVNFYVKKIPIALQTNGMTTVNECYYILTLPQFYNPSSNLFCQYYDYTFSVHRYKIW